MGLLAKCDAGGCRASPGGLPVNQCPSVSGMVRGSGSVVLSGGRVNEHRTLRVGGKGNERARDPQKTQQMTSEGVQGKDRWVCP